MGLGLALFAHAGALHFNLGVSLRAGFWWSPGNSEPGGCCNRPDPQRLFGWFGFQGVGFRV